MNNAQQFVLKGGIGYPMAKIDPSHIMATGRDLADAMKNYSSPAAVTSGMEMELFLLNRDGTLPNATAHNSLYLSLRRGLGDLVSVEPGAHMIELKSGVHQDTPALIEDLLSVLQIVRDQAAAAGLKVHTGSNLPGYTTAQLAANLIDRIDPETGNARRSREMVEAYKAHDWNSIVEWGASTTSIHYTHSIANADQLHRYARVHAAMMPVYYAAFENRTRHDGVHTGLQMRRMMGERGLVAPYVFAARDGNDFVDRYVAAVQSNQVLTAFDARGQDVILPCPSTFGEFHPSARTLGNLLNTASASWNVCRIKPLVDCQHSTEGNLALSRLLLEVRDLDVSEAAVPAIAGWLGLLTRSEEALCEAESRLEALGVPVCSDPQAAGLRTAAALRAIEAPSRTLDTAYGDPGARLTVRDAVTRLVMPMLSSEGDSGAAIDLWARVAASRNPVFASPVAAQATPPYPMHAGLAAIPHPQHGRQLAL